MIGNPLGAVYRVGEAWSRDQAVAHSRAANHYTTTSLDDFTLAQRLKKEAGVTYSIFRNTSWEPGDLKGKTATEIKAAAQEAYRAISNTDRSIHILINNEQEWTNERFTFYAELLEATMKDPAGPVGMVFGNFASGVIQGGQGDDPNMWLTTPAAQHFLYRLDALSHVRLPDGTFAFLLGIHEYTALYPWSASNSGEYLTAEWAKLPIKIDWAKNQWHIGRVLQGIRNAGLPVPRMIVTETLFDDMQDIVKAWNVRNKVPATGIRGYKTLKEFWKAFIPEAPLGTIYHHFLSWAWENVWATSDRILGAQVYIYNGIQNIAADASFDVAQDEAFKKANQLYRYGQQPPQEPPVEEIPTTDDIKLLMAAVDRLGTELDLTKQKVKALEESLGAIPATFVHQDSLQGYFEQLMNWVAVNFVSKHALESTARVLLEALASQNVEDRK